MTSPDPARNTSSTPTPTWLTEACPSWCTRIHEEDDHPEDRYHHSEESLFPAIASSERTLPVTDALESADLSLRIGRHVGEHLTWVVLEPEEERQPRLVLTIESAQLLATHLNDQLSRYSPG